MSKKRALRVLRADQRGFSILELAIALGVVLSTIAIIPIAQQYTPEQQVNHVAQAMADDLRQARSESVKFGNDVVVTFDTVHGVLSTYNDVDNNGPDLNELIRARSLANYGGGASFRLVASFGIDGHTVTAPVVMGATNNPISVTFHANGSATNSGVIYMGASSDPRPMLGRAVSVLATGVIQTWKFANDTPTSGWVRWY
jgi:type II secretory pathway pseudopilin PulG